MEFFSNAKAVRLQSHLAKYLQASDDQETVRQTRNGTSPHVRWTVEFVPGKPHVIRLKSCFGKYLSAAADPFLLGTAGKKVLQRDSSSTSDDSLDWEPRKDGFYVKMRTKAGKFLRANGGAPPWRNSVTHDIPRRTSTQDWVLWSVDVVDITVGEDLMEAGSISPATSFSSFSSNDYDLDTGCPSMSMTSSSRFRSPSMEITTTTTSSSSRRLGSSALRDLSGMELFQKAKAVRLRSHHDKYLLAEDDEDTVCQDRNGSVRNAKWTVEIVDHSNTLRFKSCYGKYLTASNIPFLMGMTGKKVLQTLPARLDSSLEWEPIREGFQVRLKTRYGQYLRANGGVPPWRNSITHDIPHRTATQDWILWDVDVVEIRVQSPPRSQVQPEPESPPDSPPRPPPPPPSHVYTRHESSETLGGSPMKAEGRVIHYHVANERGDVKEGEGVKLIFKGSKVDELKERLKEETGLHDIVVCSRNPLNGKLFPLRLHLPPNNADMHVVVVPSSQGGGASGSP